MDVGNKISDYCWVFFPLFAVLSHVLAGIAEASLNHRVPSSPTGTNPAPRRDPCCSSTVGVAPCQRRWGTDLCKRMSVWRNSFFSAGSIPLSDSACGCIPSCAGHGAACKWKWAARGLGTENCIVTGVGTASWTSKFLVLNQHLLENSEFPEILVYLNLKQSI